MSNAQVAYMCEEIARALDMPVQMPADTVHSVRGLAAYAEGLKRRVKRYQAMVEEQGRRIEALQSGCQAGDITSAQVTGGQPAGGVEPQPSSDGTWPPTGAPRGKG